MPQATSCSTATTEPRRRVLLRRITLLALAVLLAAAIAGCGSDDDGSKDAGDGGAGKLQHVDGTIVVEDGNVVVSPADPSKPAITLVIGPAVEMGPVQGLATSGARARIYFEQDGEKRTAASIEPAPTLEKGVKTYTGIVVEVKEGSITVGGDEGDRTFTIAKEDRGQFESGHLLEHKETSEKIKVYYRTEQGTDRATAYEDA